MASYYNENDAYVAQWLRNLIAAGLIPAGDVDNRSIVDVKPDDLRGYTQCHFFAGIGGWPYALCLAGWPDAAEVWTGSCPCQPLSCAGQRKGDADERHLWPAFFRLIAERRPATVFGEQVASKDGREWLSAVRADLEAVEYAVGAADLCAASVGAPHIRQRLWWVAHTMRPGRTERRTSAGIGQASGGGGTGVLAHSNGAGLEVERQQSARQECTAAERSGETGTMEHATGEQVGISGRAREQGSASGELGDAERIGFRDARCEQNDGAARRVPSADRERQRVRPDARPTSRNPWSDLEWLPCIDGKSRPTKPGLQPLAHGIPARVGKLRAAGNAIVAPLAAEFVGAFMECKP